MLVCLVNDVLDLKQIEDLNFTPKKETFSPTATFNFVTSMFAPQLAMQKAKLWF